MFKKCLDNSAAVAPVFSPACADLKVGATLSTPLADTTPGLLSGKAPVFLDLPGTLAHFAPKLLYIVAYSLYAKAEAIVLVPRNGAGSQASPHAPYHPPQGGSDVTKESLAGPSPHERAAEIALAHPDVALMQRMGEASFRQIWRITTLLLKIKSQPREGESGARSARTRNVYEKKAA
jgi:hypothetical protein